MSKEYLTEENYQKGKKKVSKIGIIILLVGLSLGGGLIAIGIKNQLKINYEYSEENKLKLAEQVESEREKLLIKKSELEAKGITYNYDNVSLSGEEYDLYYITRVLNPTFNYCSQDEYKTNTLTSKYCSVKNDLEEKSDDFNKSFSNGSTIPFYVIGAFVIMSTFMYSFFVLFVSKGREIMAFTTQQTMPIAKEGMEKISPSIGKAAGEIAKGIKESLKKEDKK